VDVANFDPAAATAAYLATLPPAAHAKAAAYTHGGHWILLWGWAVSLIAAFLIVRSRLLARAEERIERRRPHPVWASAVAAALYILLDAVLELPWSVYAQWWREKQYGLTSQPLAGWLGEQTLSLAISLVVTTLFLVVFYALIRHARRLWWAWAGGFATLGVLFLFAVGPVFVEPLFNTYTPAPQGPVREAVVALAKKAGVPSDKIYIYNGSKQSNRYTANVSGLWGTARVAMSDTMFAKGADLAEVRGVVGHEMGHYKHGHAIWIALIYGGLATLLFFLTDRLFPYAANLMGADVHAIADPAGLPVIAAVVATLTMLATPLTNTVTRWTEADADRFSLQYANEPDGLSRALVQTIAYRAATPSRIEEIIFYDHPSVSRRIRRAMDWKAAHMNGAAN
jgi:STE24 endopeptidase